jgi:molybdopterin-guanine dinucleotide biosynthesis protein A
VEGSALLAIGKDAGRTGPHEAFYPAGTPWSVIESENGKRGLLIIESDDCPAGLVPDCLVHLGSGARAASADSPPRKADFHSGRAADAGTIERCAGRLGLGAATVRRIAWLSGSRPEPVTAIVLTGGKSSRLGPDKAFLDFGGERLVDRITRRLGESVDGIVIATSADKAGLFPGHKVAVDEIPDQGPLRGIVSGLARSETRLNFVIACDMPDVDTGTLRELLSWSEGFDAVVPSFREGEREPLFAVYRKTLLDPALGLLERGERRVASLYPLCRTKILFLPRNPGLANINTRDDYENYIGGKKRTARRDPI